MWLPCCLTSHPSLSPPATASVCSKRVSIGPATATGMQLAVACQAACTCGLGTSDMAESISYLQLRTATSYGHES
jgi:hypothetical protein